MPATAHISGRPWKVIGGVFVAFQMKQEVFPEFDIDAVRVEVPYPGASPAEVEEAALWRRDWVGIRHEDRIMRGFFSVVDRSLFEIFDFVSHAVPVGLKRSEPATLDEESDGGDQRDGGGSAPEPKVFAR